jgi:hypothetical protein
MKILIIINEPFCDMAVGRSTNLAYILSCAKLGHEVYIYDLANNFLPKEPKSLISTFYLTGNNLLCSCLLKNYQKLNEEIMLCVAQNNLQKLHKLKVKKVAEFLAPNIMSQSLPLKKVILSEIEFIIQRLEPMKAPFPPVGKANMDQILTQIQKLFPQFIFNCPLYLGDKEVPQEINRILQKQIATPTASFVLKGRGKNCAPSLQDEEMEHKACLALPDRLSVPKKNISKENISGENMPDGNVSGGNISGGNIKNLPKTLELMAKEYQKLYGKKTVKLVFKPKNSAQSLGVFAIEFAKNGLNLLAIKTKKITELRAAQIYKISNYLSGEELEKIIEILCYIQNLKNVRNARNLRGLKKISRAEIIQGAKNLYNQEILVQPFLEGVKSGDVRTNFLKDQNGNFYIAGHTFRKSLRIEKKNFTTGYSAGGATSQPILILKKTEIKNLLSKAVLILKILNGPLKTKYHHVIELGADFILVGDGKNIFLGEINHHCQALIPISEAMAGATDPKFLYGFGLGLTAKAITDTIALQIGQNKKR